MLAGDSCAEGSSHAAEQVRVESRHPLTPRHRRSPRGGDFEIRERPRRALGPQPGRPGHTPAVPGAGPPTTPGDKRGPSRHSTTRSGLDLFTVMYESHRSVHRTRSRARGSRPAVPGTSRPTAKVHSSARCGTNETWACKIQPRVLRSGPVDRSGPRQRITGLITITGGK